MWQQMPQQQNLVYDVERVGFQTDSRGGNGFLTYSENATTSAISAYVTKASVGTALQDAGIKGFIEKQRSDDYTTTTAAGAGVPIHVLGNNGFEIWVLYLDGDNDVVRGGANFINS